MTKREIAENYFKQGYNCSQSVALAFSKEINMDEKTVAMMASGFGGGFGRLREVCGAVSGMVMVLGALEGDCNTEDKMARLETYKKVQELVLKFKEQNGSFICRELIGMDGKNTSPNPVDRTAEFYKKRPCVSLVGDAAEILEKYLNNK